MPSFKYDKLDNKLEILLHSLNLESQSIFTDLAKYQLDNKEITRICEYLQNPTNKGVWFLTFYWKSDSGITSEVEKEIENRPLDEENTKSNEKNGLFGSKNELLEDINKFSFIFSLFTYICSRAENLKYPTPKKGYNRWEVIQALDLEKIKEKYQEAYDFFKNEIYFDGFDPSIYSKTVFKIKDGFIILDSKSKNGNVSLSSLSYSPLEKMKNFFTKIGKIRDCRIRPEYSPEEKVFAPYFSLLEEVYIYVIHEEKVTRLFKKAIDEYKDANYEYCISTLGLIAEDYLTQVYETFHREPIPKKQTLGQIYDLINNKINNQSQAKIVSAPDINSIYGKLNNFLSENSEIDQTKRNQDTIKLIREMLHFVQEDKKHTRYLIDNINKKESKVSLFPGYIKENVTELIRHRNATSHNSRISIGQYEAQRMVYCCITLIMWWTNEKDIIDWKEDQKIIIEKTIERNQSLPGEL